MTLRLLACGRTGRRTAIPARSVETPRRSSVNLFKRHTTSAFSSVERSESRPVFTRRYLNRSRMRDLVGRRLVAAWACAARSPFFALCSAQGPPGAYSSRESKHRQARDATILLLVLFVAPDFVSSYSHSFTTVLDRELVSRSVHLMPPAFVEVSDCADWHVSDFP